MQVLPKLQTNSNDFLAHLEPYVAMLASSASRRLCWSQIRKSQVFSFDVIRMIGKGSYVAICRNLNDLPIIQKFSKILKIFLFSVHTAIEVLSSES